MDEYYEEIMGEPLDEDTKDIITEVGGMAEGFLADNGNGASQIVMGMLSSASAIAMTLY
jgi:hypothetical protein